ncbi:MAG: TlpA family protein disulfide reductase [Deltaproteobacteria bacterium]|nr:TlpA family protein disulfide reductase [Deltaproteobacteria bacterium]
MRRALLALALAACGSAGPDAPTATAPTVAPPAEREEKARVAVAAMIGTTPPEWQAERWMNSPPLELAKLRGSVVMVRWWTAGCPFCSTTAPALRAFDREYTPRGLRVIGMYHHKEDTPFEPKVYENTAKKYELTFPVAFDPEWRTLESWLRDANGREVSTGWTSVTFLLDKRGVIRHVHPGGSYVEGEPAHAELRAQIERLLAE